MAPQHDDNTHPPGNGRNECTAAIVARQGDWVSGPKHRVFCTGCMTQVLDGKSD